MINRVVRALDFASIFYVFAGSLSFLSYIFISQKYHYLLFGLLIYGFSYVIRTFITKQKYSVGVTEAGLFFISLVFLAFVLNLTGIDKEVYGNLPNQIFLYSGFTYIGIFLFSLLGNNKKFILLLVVIFLVLQFFQYQQSLLTSFLIAHPNIASFFVGTPYVYLLKLLVGFPNLNQKK